MFIVYLPIPYPLKYIAALMLVILGQDISFFILIWVTIIHTTATVAPVFIYYYYFIYVFIS